MAVTSVVYVVGSNIVRVAIAEGQEFQRPFPKLYWRSSIGYKAHAAELRYKGEMLACVRGSIENSKLVLQIILALSYLSYQMVE